MKTSHSKIDLLPNAVNRNFFLEQFYAAHFTLHDLCIRFVTVNNVL